MGKKVKTAVSFVTGGIVSGLLMNEQTKAVEAQKNAIKSQQQQQQALIDEQRNAEATAKAQATAMRRAEMAGQTQTKYATALGSSDDETTSVKKKKTVLGG